MKNKLFLKEHKLKNNILLSTQYEDPYFNVVYSLSDVLTKLMDGQAKTCSGYDVFLSPIFLDIVKFRIQINRNP